MEVTEVRRPRYRIYAKLIFYHIAIILLALSSYLLLTRDISVSLWPHARVLNFLCGIEFYFSEGVGYIARDGSFSITAGCMGVKLFISAFLLLSFGFRPENRSLKSQASRLAVYYFASLAGAFALTILRISFSIPFCAVAHAQLIHNIISLFIYFGSLTLLYAISNRYLRTGGNNHGRQTTS